MTEFKLPIKVHAIRKIGDQYLVRTSDILAGDLGAEIQRLHSYGGFDMVLIYDDPAKDIHDHWFFQDKEVTRE